MIMQRVKPHSHLYPISIPKNKRLEFRVLLNEKKKIEVSRKTFPKRPRREFSQSPQCIFQDTSDKTLSYCIKST